MNTFIAVESFGLAMLVVGAVLCNSAGAKMAKALGRQWNLTIGARVDAANRKRQREVIQKYREKYGNGPQFRNLVVGYAVAGAGAAVIIFGKLRAKLLV